MIASPAIWEGIGRQLRCPSGAWGRLTGYAMALVNRKPNRLAIDALGVAPDDTVLELGFGPGRAIQALSRLARRGLVLGVDASPEMLAQAAYVNQSAIGRGRVQLRLGSFASLPWPTETVDKILAVNVAYFFNCDGREIREARRVLRPGGAMAIYATHRSTMAKWKFAGPDTHALLDENGLHALALRGGFDGSEIGIRDIELPFGVRGLLAVLKKSLRRG